MIVSPWLVTCQANQKSVQLFILSPTKKQKRGVQKMLFASSNEKKWNGQPKLEIPKRKRTEIPKPLPEKRRPNRADILCRNEKKS